jgi:hypothetical protein
LTCKGLSLGEKATASVDAILKISHSGNEIAIELDPEGTLTPSVDFAGIVAVEAKNPNKGRAVAVYCGTTPFINTLGMDHILHADGLIKPTDANPANATLKILSIVGAFPNVATCKGKFKRMDDVDPAVSGCPPPV